MENIWKIYGKKLYGKNYMEKIIWKKLKNKKYMEK